MKNTAYMIIRSLFLAAISMGILFLISCKKEEDIESNCSSYKLTVVTYPSYIEITTNNGVEIETLKTGYELYLRTVDGGDGFVENVSVRLVGTDFPLGNGPVGVDFDRSVEVSEGRGARRLLMEATGVDGVFPFSQVIISSESCKELVKDEDDIAADTEELECPFNDDLSLNEKRCGETYTFSWSSSADLSGVSYKIYGQVIDLSDGTSQSFTKSELDLNDEVGEINDNGSVCELTSTSLTICGSTGVLSLTDPLNSGETLIVTLTDGDIDTDSDNAEKITVSVSTDKGESESLELTETGISTGIFSNTLETVDETTAGTNNDGTLNANEGTVITATYEDALDDDAGTTTVTKMVTTAAPLPTCDDGIQNGDEEGVDCGGSSCEACPTCDDGIQNGDETGVDCGGSCAACALADGEITFNGTVYIMDDNFASILPSSAGGIDYLQLDMASNDGSGNTDTGITLEFYSSTSVGSGTYTVDGNPDGVSGEVSTGNGTNFFAVTGGSASITITDGVYKLTMDLTTEGGDLTGTYTFPE